MFAAFLLLGWLEVFFADSLVRVVVAASRLVEDGLLDLLAAGHIDRQLTLLIPGIEIRSVPHQGLGHLEIIAYGSGVERRVARTARA